MELNQRWLEGRWGDAARRWSRRPLVTVPRFDAAAADAIEFDRPEDVLTFVLDHCPRDLTVYPSEEYFYYQFRSRERWVSGNLRFVEAPARLWVGYFDRHDPGATAARSFDHRDGLDLTRHRTADGDVCVVRWRGREHRFLITNAWTQGAAEVRLLPGERLVTGTLDESGIGLGLVYDPGPPCFYYVLNESAPRPERLVEIKTGGHRFLIGQESRFVFMSAEGRWVLVGVHADEVRRNTYYDGPFDQIPPGLDLKAMIESVYPYVNFSGGIDRNGNFLELHGQRVAIGPYQQYAESPRAFCERAAVLVNAQPEYGWRLLTFEPKRLLHPARETGTPVPMDYRHALDVSRLWPATHFPQQSLNGPPVGGTGPGRSN